MKTLNEDQSKRVKLTTEKMFDGEAYYFSKYFETEVEADDAGERYMEEVTDPESAYKILNEDGVVSLWLK